MIAAATPSAIWPRWNIRFGAALTDANGTGLTTVVCALLPSAEEEQAQHYCCASTASPSCLAASAADSLGVLTNSVITSIAAPRYFWRMVMSPIVVFVLQSQSCSNSSSAFAWQGEISEKANYRKLS